MKTQFLPLTAQNSDPYFDLHKQGQFSPWSRKIFEDCLTKPYFAYSLNQDNQPLGYYIGMTVLDEVTLMDIVVSAAHQGKGLGQSLLQHFMAQCNQNNIQQIWLEVRESNASIH